MREFYADEAPRVIIVADHHPSMGLYSSGLPWMSKADALRAAVVGIVVAAHKVRAQVGYLDFSGLPDRDGAPYWLPPSRLSVHRLENRVNAAFDAPGNVVERALQELILRRHDAPPGCIVFVVSDFLRSPPAEAWFGARARRWDFVPVVIQDPVWEQGFPRIGRSVLPIADPVSGRVTRVRLTASDARQLNVEHATRLTDLLQLFHDLDFDPVVLGTSDPYEIDASFQTWAKRRRFT